MKIGLIGPGRMGLPMSERLIEKGYDLRFYARKSEVIDHLSHKGGKYACIKELGKECDVVLFVLNTFEQCQICLDELLLTLTRGIVVVHSTISPSEMELLGKTCNKMGIDFVAAPLTGGVAGAKQGSLTVLVGGSDNCLEELHPIFNAIGSNIVHTGLSYSSAASMKLLVQLLVGINTVATAETLILGMKSGLDPELIYSTICSSAGESRIFQNRANTIINRNFSSRGTVDIMQKDLKYCVEEANKKECMLPLVQLAHNIFSIGSNTLADTSEDFSAIVKVYEEWMNITIKSDN